MFQPHLFASPFLIHLAEMLFLQNQIAEMKSWGTKGVEADQQIKNGDFIIDTQTEEDMCDQYNQSQVQSQMNQALKQYKDGQFKPKEIRIRATYRKLRPQIKDEMAKLYYIDKLKMSKIVKKYKISFSTLTDILKRYNLQAERLHEKQEKKSEQNSQLNPSEPPLQSDQPSAKLEVKLEEGPFVFAQLCQEDDTPQYIYYV